MSETFRRIDGKRYLRYLRDNSHRDGRQVMQEASERYGLERCAICGEWVEYDDRWDGQKDIHYEC